MASPKPHVTIAIPTYNRANKSMPQTLAAARAQTYPNLEILVSDNASTDATQEILEAIKDPRITYVRHKENIGPNNNFNSCVFGCRGDYFMLLPDDDLIDPDFVECCVEALPGPNPVGLIRTGVRFVTNENEIIGERKNDVDGEGFEDLIRAWYNNRTTLYCCNTLINTAQLRSIGGFQSPNNLFQDATAHVQVAAALGYVNVQDIKASFRQHQDNFGAAARVLDWCEDSLALLNYIRNLAPPQAAESLYFEGSRFFCRMNYSFALAEPSLLKRLKLLRLVGHQFDPNASASRYFWEKEVRPAIGRLRKIIKGAIENLGLRKSF